MQVSICSACVIVQFNSSSDFRSPTGQKLKPKHSPFTWQINIPVIPKKCMMGYMDCTLPQLPPPPPSIPAMFWLHSIILYSYCITDINWFMYMYDDIVSLTGCWKNQLYNCKQGFFKKLNKKDYCNGFLQFFNR